MFLVLIILPTSSLLLATPPVDPALDVDVLPVLEPAMGSSSSSPTTERESATIESAHQAGAKVYRLNFVQQIVFIIAVLSIDKRTIKKNHSERIN